MAGREPVTGWHRVVQAEESGERLDRFVATHAGLSRARARALVEDGEVTVDGVPGRRAGTRLVAGQAVVAPATPDPGPPVAADPEVPVVVVHEDEDLVVVDKPAGLVVHPGAGRQGATLADGLLARYPELAEVGPGHRPGIVHRLDRGTSGLLVVARTEPARESLVAALAAHEVEREYAALVWGVLGADRGIVDAPVGRSWRDPTRRAVVEGGRPARTHYDVEARFSRPAPATLLACRLETGRTHQIRVHLSAIDHPVVADPAYGGDRGDTGLARPFLHARHLRLRHPRTGAVLDLSSELPEDLRVALDRFS